MSTKRAKWVLLIGLLLGILCCLIGCATYINWSNNYNESHPEEKSPIRTLSIQIDEDQREELFSQLRNFSEKHNLKFYLSLYTRETVNDRFFFVEMHGEAFHISALPKIVVPTEVDFDFIVDDPTNPPSQEMVDKLIRDLKAFISKIPNIMITEKK